MNQLSLFSELHEEKKSVDIERSEDLKSNHRWQLFVDGASRNNPGKSGAGIYILKDEQEVLKQGFFLGIKTNNEAEYLATILGLFFIDKQFKKGDSLSVISDSLLVIRQLEGSYKVRKKELLPLHRLAYDLIKRYRGTVTHVLREYNTHADAMANQGIDKVIMVPQEFIYRLQSHGIIL